MFKEMHKFNLCKDLGDSNVEHVLSKKKSKYKVWKSKKILTPKTSN